MSRILLLACLILAACASPEEVKQRQARQLAQDTAECQKLGFKTDTDALADCRLRMKELRLQQRVDETSLTFNPLSGTVDTPGLH